MAQQLDNDTGAPQQDEVLRITNNIIEQLGECDLESALTVLCGLTGQIVAELSNGQPSEVKRHANSVAENIRKAAIAKLLHDNEGQENVQ